MRLRDRKNKMGKALIDMSGNEPEPEKLQDGHATYTISDELIAKVKAELETVKDAMTRVAPTAGNEKADATILAGVADLAVEMDAFSGLISNIEVWKDTLVDNQALPINLLVGLTVAVSKLIRAKESVSGRVDDLTETCKKVTSAALLHQKHLLSGTLLDKMVENSELKAVDGENTKLKREMRSMRIALRYARMSLKLRTMQRPKRSKIAPSRGESYGSRSISRSTHRATPTYTHHTLATHHHDERIGVLPIRKHSDALHESGLRSRALSRGSIAPSRSDAGKLSREAQQQDRIDNYLQDEAYIWCQSKQGKNAPKEANQPEVRTHARAFTQAHTHPYLACDAVPFPPFSFLLLSPLSH